MADGQRDEDPDVRFSYANERTFLAWNRTSLALVTAGLAITQLLPPFDFPGGRRLIGLPLIAVGTLSASSATATGLRTTARECRAGEPLPPSPLPRLLALVVGISAAIVPRARRRSAAAEVSLVDDDEGGELG